MDAYCERVESCDEFDDDMFDLITMFHVIEHVDSPRQVVEQREGLQRRHLADIESQELLRQDCSSPGNPRRVRTVDRRERQGGWLAFLSLQVR